MVFIISFLLSFSSRSPLTNDRAHGSITSGISRKKEKQWSTLALASLFFSDLLIERTKSREMKK